MAKSKVTKQQVYEGVLNSLTTVWVSVSKASDLWAKHPEIHVRVATANIRAVIETAVEDINGLASQLDDASAKNLLDDITVRLGEYSAELQRGSVSNSEELVRTWKTSVGNILSDIAKNLPAMTETDTYKKLQARLAA